jgi:adenylate cyclase
LAPVAIAAGLAALLALAGGGMGYWWWSGFRSAESAALPLPEQPSIAVLPFKNLGEPSGERFAAGITEDVITDLSQFRDLFVIARNSTAVYADKPVDIRQVGRDLGVRYVLEGSLQTSPEQVRVTAQLIDATTGAHVWSQRYDRPFEDLLTIQTELAQTIAGTLGAIQGGRGPLRKQELGRASKEEKIAALTAYDYFLRGIMYIDKFTKEDNETARELFKKAIELKPDYGRARAKYAITYQLEYLLGWSTSPEKTLQEGVELAQAAIAADESDSWAHWPLASGYLYQRRYDESLVEYQRAVALNPNDADVLSDYGWALAYFGKADQGVEAGKKAMRLNPYYPGWYSWNLGLDYYAAHRYEEAAATLEAFHEHNVQSRLFLAASYAQLGRSAEAKQQVAEALKLVAGYTIERAASMEMYRNPADLEHYVDGLRKAGLTSQGQNKGAGA